MSARTLKPPALMRRAYCGSRVTPCPSDPCRSASAINAATVAASSPIEPSFVSACWIKAFSRLKVTVVSDDRISTPASRGPGCEATRERLAALKQRPQVANVGHGFDRKHRLDQFLRLVASQHRRGEVTRLLDHLG